MASENYLLDVSLVGLRPQHARSVKLSCPADANFLGLHFALQEAFRHEPGHLFQFTVANPEYGEPWSGDPENLFWITDPTVGNDGAADTFFFQTREVADRFTLGELLEHEAVRGM